MTHADYEDEGNGLGLPSFLRDPVGILRRRWAWIILGLIVGTAGTAFAVWRVELTYQATAKILVASQQIPEEFVRTTVVEDPFSRINAMVSSVLSRRKLVDLIEEFGLYPELAEKATSDELAGLMRASITIEPEKQPGRSRRHETAMVYAISFVSKDPEVAADVANRLAALFLEAGLKTRMEHAIGISNFLRTELDRTDVEMREHGKLITEFKEAHRGELPDDQEANLRRMERYQDHRANLARQIAETEARVAMMTMQAEERPLEGSPEAQLKNLRARYELELALHTPEHPTILSLERQIGILEEQVAERARLAPNGGRQSGANAAQKTVDVLRTQLAETEAILTELDTKVQRTPKVAEELSALEEKAKVLREKYVEFLRKVNEAEMAQTLESAQYGARVSVLDRAHAPNGPVQSRKKLLLMGIAACLGLAVALGLGIEILDPVMVDAAQVEAMTGLPVLGSVPKLR